MPPSGPRRRSSRTTPARSRRTRPRRSTTPTSARPPRDDIEEERETTASSRQRRRRRPPQDDAAATHPKCEERARPQLQGGLHPRRRHCIPAAPLMRRRRKPRPSYPFPELSSAGRRRRSTRSTRAAPAARWWGGGSRASTPPGQPVLSTPEISVVRCRRPVYARPLSCEPKIAAWIGSLLEAGFNIQKHCAADFLCLRRGFGSLLETALGIHESIIFLIPTTSLHSLELFFPSPMEDRFCEEDQWHFQYQDFSSFQSRSSAGDYLLEEEALFSAQRFCATSTCSESTCSQDELGDLSDVDFPSFWAQMEEYSAHGKSKEGDCEKALIEYANGKSKEGDCEKAMIESANGKSKEGDCEKVMIESANGKSKEGDCEKALIESANGKSKEGDCEKALIQSANGKSKEGDCEIALIESANVQMVAEIPPGRRAGGSSEAKKELTLDQVSQHFSVPIKQAARELNLGVTVLKKQCRKLGIPRWPYRKVKSLQKLIDNIQELWRENAQENEHLTRSLVEFMQQTIELLRERPDVMLDQRTEELRQVCFKVENAQEDGHLIRSVVEFLQLTKKMMQERPDVILDQRTKHLRQVCFKETFKRKRLVGGHGTC